MSRRNGNIKIAFAAFVITTLAACNPAGFSSSSTTVSPGGPTITPGPSPTPTPTCATSNTVNVTTSYAGLSNASLTVGLYNNGDNTYYGNVQLSYSAGGAQYNENYSAPQGTNPTYSGLYDNGTSASAFNYFYNNGQYFSGFYQNGSGSLVLSVNAVVNGCASGNIYFMNFVQNGSVQSPLRTCWFIYNGPYDCRDNNIINKTSLQPAGQYQIIGSFTGLPVNQAFH